MPNVDVMGGRSALSAPVGIPQDHIQRKQLDDRTTSLAQDHAPKAGSWAYGTGWASYAGGWGAPRIIRTGKLVVITGLVKRASGAGTFIGNVQEGFRPLDTLMFTAATDTGYGVFQINQGGDITHLGGGTGWVTLSGVVYPSW